MDGRKYLHIIYLSKWPMSKLTEGLPLQQQKYKQSSLHVGQRTSNHFSKNAHILNLRKDAQCHSPGECKPKPPRGITPHAHWDGHSNKIKTNRKQQETMETTRNTGRWGPSCPVGGKVRWRSHYENQCGGPSKTKKKNRTQQCHFWEYIQKNPKKDLREVQAHSRSS